MVEPAVTGHEHSKTGRPPHGVLSLVGSACVAALFFFFVYDPRTAVTLQESDGAEFAAAAVHHSLVHPPGYPLYSWIASALVKAVPCNPYHTLASFSALCQALAVGALVWVLAILSRSWLIAASLAFGWALFEPTVRTAVDAEVFALHHLLIALLLGAIVWSVRARRSQDVALAALALTFAAAVSHHHTVVLFFPLAAALALPLPRARLGAALLLGSICACVLYATLFVRYRLAPELAFAPLESGIDFLTYVLRGGYGTFSLAIASNEMPVHYFGELFSGLWQASPAAILLGFCIVPFVFIRPSRITIGAFLTMLLVLLFAAALKLPPPRSEYAEWIMRFYPTVALGLTVIAAAAYGELRWGRRPAAILVTLMTVLALIATAPGSLRRADASSDTVVQDEVESALFSSPPQAVLLVGSDRLAFGLRYQQTVLKARSDVLVVVSGMLESESYRNRIAAHMGSAASEKTVNLESPGEIGRAFLEQGRPVLSEWFIAPPPGIQVFRHGVLSSWRLPGEAGLSPKFDVRFCEELPRSLVDLPEERERSREIIERSFLEPLKLSAPERVRDETVLFDHASRRGREIEALRAICHRWLEQASMDDPTRE